MPSLVGAKSRSVSETAVDYAASELATASGQHEYLALLGLRSFDTASLLKRLDEGLSFAAFERLKRRLKVSSQGLADAAMISRRTLARRKSTGRLDPDESDRLVRIARVFSRSIELYGGNEDSARRWMMRPRPALGGPSPFEMARTEVGAREVEKLIHQLEHGVVI